MRRVRLFPRTAHSQIALIATLFFVLGTFVFSLGMIQLGNVRESIDRADEQLAPAAAHLSRAEQGFSTSHEAFLDMLASSDELERAALLSLTTESQAKANDEWLAFKARRAEVADSNAFVQAVDYDIANLTAQGATVLAGDPHATEVFEESFDSLSTNINTLERRYSTAARNATHTASIEAAETHTTVFAAYAVVLVVFVVATIIAVQLTRRRERRERSRERDRSVQADRDELDARLQRALEMSSTESSAFAVLDAALRRSIPVTPADLLVADSPRGHLRRVATTTDPACEGACGVSAPSECPAASRGKTMVFGGSDALDSCPTRERHGASTAATTCVPVNVGGQPSGVICTTGPIDQPVDGRELSMVELIARKAGERLTLMRSFAKSENLASTDPLTGIANRRSMEEKIDEIVAAGRQYVVAYGDLDHFKLINDVYGHDAGDRALRLFARSLRDSIRPSDIPCRFGGEEFLIVLPDCSVDEAAIVLERLRARLGAALEGADVPPFTVSFGVSGLDDGRLTEAVIAEADAALRRAKTDGRDRVVVTGTSRAEVTAGDNVSGR